MWGTTCGAETSTHYKILQHTATHCNTLLRTRTCKCVGSWRARLVGWRLQHTATHCNTLQHTATHCNTLLHTRTCKCVGSWRARLVGWRLQHTKQYYNTLLHTATRCHTHVPASVWAVGEHDLSVGDCNTLQNTATRCNTLQHATLLHTHTCRCVGSWQSRLVSRNSHVPRTHTCVSRTHAFAGVWAVGMYFLWENHCVGVC